MSKPSTRLNKYISESGLCSRRAADRFIALGQVFINGKKATVGDQVYVGDKVSVNGQKIAAKEADEFIIIAYNKPIGVTSTTESKVKDNIVEHVNYSERVFPIGRLDKDSSGLIFLTNNGDLVNKILRAGNNHEKEYLVTVNKPIDEQFVYDMGHGVPILDVVTRKCKVVKEGSHSFRITLIQGLNRQIRRMCEYFDYEVVKLERTRIMNISLKGLPVGDWRELTEEEQAQIYKQVSNSSSEQTKPTKSATKAAKQKEKSPLAFGKLTKPKSAPHAKKNEDKRTGPFNKAKTEGPKGKGKPMAAPTKSQFKSSTSSTSRKPAGQSRAKGGAPVKGKPTAKRK